MGLIRNESILERKKNMVRITNGCEFTNHFFLENLGARIIALLSPHPNLLQRRRSCAILRAPENFYSITFCTFILQL